MVNRDMNHLLHEDDNALSEYLWTSISVQDILPLVKVVRELGFTWTVVG